MAYFLNVIWFQLGLEGNMKQISQFAKVKNKTRHWRSKVSQTWCVSFLFQIVSKDEGWASQRSLFFTSRLVIDSAMCCPPSCCSSQPLVGCGGGGKHTSRRAAGCTSTAGGRVRVVLWGVQGSRALLALRHCCQVDSVVPYSKGSQPFINRVRGAYFFLRGWFWLVGALRALYCTCKNKQEFGQRQVIRAQWSAQ